MSSDTPFNDALRDLRRLASGGRPPRPPVASPKGDEEDPNMEHRIKRLEDDVRAIRSDLAGVVSRLGAVEGKLDLLVTQIVAKIPSSLQLFSLMVGTLVAIVSILGGAIALAQWLRLIPW